VPITLAGFEYCVLVHTCVVLDDAEALPAAATGPSPVRSCCLPVAPSCSSFKGSMPKVQYQLILLGLSTVHMYTRVVLNNAKALSLQLQLDYHQCAPVASQCLPVALRSKAPCQKSSTTQFCLVCVLCMYIHTHMLYSTMLRLSLQLLLDHHQCAPLASQCLPVSLRSKAACSISRSCLA
jgi:hypothetical protein